MEGSSADTSYFSSICIEQCKGLCCDPWWGIITYNIVKEGGLSDLNSFREEVIKGIRSRAQRIMEGYMTREAQPRPLFSRPERYNVAIRDVKVKENSLLMNVMAMFAFRCLFFSLGKACAIHPAKTGGDDIRPPHCGYMGSLKVRAGEKGYCRIIHAAEPSTERSAVKSAIEVEKTASERHYGEGVPTEEMATDKMISQLKEYCAMHLSHLLPRQNTLSIGRNDPCYCGSGIKYKKCHGH